MIVISVVLLVLALLLLITGVLGWTGRLPGNPVLGIHVAEVRKSEDVWVLAHRAAGPLWIAGGILTLVGAVISFGATGWMWLLPVIAVIAGLVFVGAGAGLGARVAAAADVAANRNAGEGDGCSSGGGCCGGGADDQSTTQPAVDLDAVRRAASQADGR
ncbi:SdpI family protein [Corynebacterium sp. CCM 8835]|uniref:SdpI family protein n=1 Tax=Corynebacterium antarcticum TaxID=2800405 RepID=A0ABS1FLK9_9CORY|nr:SdpI family protein [Corynebacterium antarcticum]MCK7642691.1 SdpI family protein [Corynebacterium antarcticum]MCK7660621.1 SdpI family protein [Corynebacterium antarcticum]MCL0245367.1 SdpI family protein [Corynebacterium antarcticum]MCX7492178.1 SdpI family protein [Corynebacterium antarcticum]MCX7539937.1 SdpI family protein [Corynebacterium antarcticum]